jgi:hypothetical protein
MAVALLAEMIRGRLLTTAIAGTAVALGRSIVRKRRIARQLVASERAPWSLCDEVHAKKVQRIAAQLRAHDGKKPVSLRKKAPPHQVPKGGDLRRRDAKIDVSDLTTIIDIDPVKRVCIAESGVMFCDLVEATLRYGLVPIVVPELKTITVGGAAAAFTTRASSTKSSPRAATCSYASPTTSTRWCSRCCTDRSVRSAS